MTSMTKKELVKTTKPRYLKADKKSKGKILDEFCSNVGFNRKYAVTILQAGYEYEQVEKCGRKRRKIVYGSAVILPVIKIWELLEYPCGKRLQPVLASTAKAMMRHGELAISQKAVEQLSRISAKTLDRRLGKERTIRRLKRNRGTTRHGSLLKSSIPIRITEWDTNELGFMEMDTVAHNGGDPAGEFIYSLDLVEIYTGWSEQIAIMGKGQLGVVKAIDQVKQGLPFQIKGCDSDSGSEFINWHLVDYCQKNSLYFTRSRPDRKNDNAYVEQKNNTHIRHWLGYGRYDTIEQLKMINDLYRNELRLFNNFFRPVMKIKSKEKINNSVCKKTYDQAQTPYRRLMSSGQISDEKKQALKELYLSLNPVQLKRAIDEKLNQIKNFKPIYFKNLSTSMVRNYVSQPVGAMVRFLND
ncbi:MAG: hypothetical protein A2298_05415 [Gammaproteobacteria bacterium RIFOXYB2_FULL_38_6]|nr:MAG: hypothetical protein A2298_05415 [Gammaproteobacteria bacterium RIFOXYB2_FULL_38_6]